MELRIKEAVWRFESVYAIFDNLHPVFRVSFRGLPRTGHDMLQIAGRSRDTSCLSAGILNMT